MLGYLLCLIFGVAIGYFSHGLITGEMSILGRYHNQKNFNIIKSEHVNPYYLRGIRARLTSIGSTFLISFFGLMLIGNTSFKNFYLHDFLNIISKNPIKAITLLTFLIPGILVGFKLKNKEIILERPLAEALNSQKTNQSGGTNKIL